MLIICPTPIGNLQDVTPRQRAALSEADVIACEDTRTTGKLLERLGIERGHIRLVSYHDHNALDRVEELIDALAAGQRVTLVSDAGTPTISDPGFRLVQAAARAQAPMTALPGPVAALTALSASGLPSDRFFFEGFLPSKHQARLARLEQLRHLGVTVLCYESPHRIVRTLEDVAASFGPDHVVCAARELTKMHEEYLRGTAQDIADTLAQRERVRGEFVLILSAPDAAPQLLDGDALDARIVELLEQGMRTKAVRDIISSKTDLASSTLYERIEQLKRAQ